MTPDFKVVDYQKIYPEKVNEFIGRGYKIWGGVFVEPYGSYQIVLLPCPEESERRKRIAEALS